ncbi:hypothetical protein ACOBQJ_09270 [Pelotomaculum propionicicum]|uniref:hypothetical protein n=1 Tax=Pelotomaculum propionicicum TaxID=258475 RepID=UPI003B766111
MYSFLSFLLGVIAVIGVVWLLGFLRMRDIRLKWYVWASIAVWYLWTVAGISFVSINAAGKHAKAASTGAFIFFIVTIIAGVLLARLIGVLNPSKGLNNS